MLKTPSRATADDSAIKLLCIAEFFYTLPILGIILYQVGGSEFLVWVIVGLGYALLLNLLNQRYFIKGGELKRLKERHKNESGRNSRIGFGIVIVIWLFSLAYMVLLAKIFSSVGEN